jgi:hypothetical protein
MANIEGLSDSELAGLTSLYRSEGYQTLLKIMADLHGKAIDDYVDADPSDEKKIIARHNILNAQRKFADEIQFQVKQLVETWTGINNKSAPMSKIEQLLSALPINENEM